jgi:hypothetical protein
LSVPAHAQDEDETAGAEWRLQELDRGFCVQFLIDPARLTRELPDGRAPGAAAEADDLHPALRSLVEGQAEYASWTPSRLCLYYFGEIDAAGRRIRERDRRKAPMIGFWTVAAPGSDPNRPRDYALEVFTTSGRVEDASKVARLEMRRVKSTVAPVPADADGVFSGEDRHRIRIGGTELVWDGRPGADSTRVGQERSRRWTAKGHRRKEVDGTMTLTPEWTRAMVGSLKIEGKDRLARLLRESPTRFVGPSFQGGSGTFRVE